MSDIKKLMITHISSVYTEQQ